MPRLQVCTYEKLEVQGLRVECELHHGPFVGTLDDRGLSMKNENVHDSKGHLMKTSRIILMRIKKVII